MKWEKALDSQNSTSRKQVDKMTRLQTCFILQKKNKNVKKKRRLILMVEIWAQRTEL